MESTTTSSKLKKIPDEILLLIIENTERTSLPAFLLASRQIHKAGTPVLYRFIQCDIPNSSRRRTGPRQMKYGLEGSPKHLSWSRISLVFDFQKFIETLKRNQSLRPLVFGASLNIEEMDGYMWDPDTRKLLSARSYSDARISHPMDLILPSLKYLEVKGDDVDLSLLSSVPSASVKILNCQVNRSGRII